MILMEKKKIGIFSVIVIALVCSIITGTFTYFAVSFTDERIEQGETIVKTEELPDAVVISNIDKSAGKFEASDIYPGHKEVASLSVSANGVVGTSASYQFKYEVNTNELGDAVKVSLYVTVKKHMKT